MSKKIVTVIGIGRVGLPLSLYISNMNYIVYGIGRTQSKIDQIAKGHMPFIEEGAKLLKKNLNKSFFPTISYESIKTSNVVILTLGTPIDENMNPVLDQINEAIDRCLPLFKKNQLIILRSTVSPETTTYVKEKIEMNTKFKVGKDIFLAFCPERIAEGFAITETLTTPQIIGGIDELSTSKADTFFKSLKIKTITTDATSAELAKLFTNMYRYINFAISNEFAVISESYNRNVHEIINLVNYKYKRGGLALPGLTGGPCLFKDGFFLVNQNPYLDLITASWKINESFPLFLVETVKERIDLKNKNVLIMGLSFKPDIDDIRESLSFKIRKALLREHSSVALHDPYVKNYNRGKVFNDLDEAIKNIDIIFIATRHKKYEKKSLSILKKLKKDVYICDIWNLFGTNKIVFTVEEAIKNKKK